MNESPSLRKMIRDILPGPYSRHGMTLLDKCLQHIPALRQRDDLLIPCTGSALLCHHESCFMRIELEA